MRLLMFVFFMIFASSVSGQEYEGVAPESLSVQEQSNVSANEANSAAEEFGIPVRIIESSQDAEHRRNREQKSDQHAADDLKAQRRAADAADRSATTAEGQILPTWIQAGVAVVGTIALIITVIQSMRATNAAVNANKIAQASFIAAHRPWIAIETPAVSIHSDDGNFPVVFAKVRTTNFGKGPAMGVAIHIKVEFPKLPLDNSLHVEGFVSGLTKPNKWKWGNTVIFPENSPILQGISDAIDNSAPRRGNARLIVCATYKAQGSEEIFHAARAFKFPTSVFNDINEDGGFAIESVEVTYISGSDSVG